MWYFKSRGSSAVKIALLVGKDYVLGRRDCDILIENDPSVSRKHAILRVTHPEANITHVDRQPDLTLKDTSTFGTLVNNEKIHGEVILKDGDEIRFGSPRSVYCVVYEPLVVTTSCLDSAGKKEVRSAVWQLGGHTVGEWHSSCCLLVMHSINVTIKVVCALASQTPIVTPKYLQQLLLCLKEERNTPDAAEFLPPVAERHIRSDVSFLPDLKRATVFQGTQFYFLSAKQFQRMAIGVEAAGGLPMLTDCDDNSELSCFVDGKAVVMSPSQSDIRDKQHHNWVAKVTSHLKKHGKYLVQEAEIGYAVLYGSTSDYCNANKDVSHLLPASFPSESMSQAGGPTQSSQFTVSNVKTLCGQDRSTVKAAGTTSSSIVDPVNVSDNIRKAEMQLAQGNKPGLLAKDNDPLQPGTLQQVKCEPDVLPEHHQGFIVDTPGSLQVKHCPQSLNTVPDSLSAPYGEDGLKIKTEKKMMSLGCTSEEPLVLSSDDDDDEVVIMKKNSEKSAPSTRKCQTNLPDKESETKNLFKNISKKSPFPRKCMTNLSDDESEPENPFENMSRKSASSMRKRQANLSEDESKSENPFQKLAKRQKVSKMGEKDGLEGGLGVRERSTKETLDETSDMPFGDLVPCGSKLKEAGTKDLHQKPSAHHPSEVVFRGEELECPSQSGDREQMLEGGAENKNHGRVEHAPRTLNVAKLEGFLTAQRPQDLATDESRTHKVGSSVVIKVQDLVVRQPGREAQKFHSSTSCDTADGMTTWNGQLVRNVKKFRKVLHAGAHQLPHIIGGRGLEEHRAQSKVKMDEWLLEMQQAETEQSQREREMQELFDWQPTTKAGKQKR